MQSQNHNEHHLITIYEDDKKNSINKLVSRLIQSKNTRILCPNNEEELLKASQNSSLVLIGAKNQEDYNLNTVKTLKNNRMIVCDIVAVIKDVDIYDSLKIMEKGFDWCISLNETNRPEFKKILLQRIASGGKRLSTIILEEEYRRFSDALSCAPTSVIVFDNDKRIVFVSEHYFRAYPKSAPRLKRGLSAFDAFDMMSKEEGISPEDPRFKKLRDFWYTLNGDIQFELDNAIIYRLKATTLPSQRGTIVTAQNITEYLKQNKES